MGGFWGKKLDLLYMGGKEGGEKEGDEKEGDENEGDEKEGNEKVGGVRGYPKVR